MTIRRKIRFIIAGVLLDYEISNPGLTDTLADTVIDFFQNEDTESPAKAVIEVVSKATGIVAIPTTEYPRIEQIHALIKHYGKQAVIDAFKWAFTKWVATKRAKGGNYSRVNFGWVDWGQEKLMEDAEKSNACKKVETEEVWINGELFLKPVEVKA